MKIRSLLLSALTLAMLSSPVFAQCSGNAPTNTFCGNVTGGSALPGWRTVTPGVFQPIAAGTVLGNPTGASAVPIATVAPILGLAGSALGTLGLSGNSSGLITLRSAADAGTYNFVFPATAGTVGYPLLSGGGGSNPHTYNILGLDAGGTATALTASNGGIVYSTGSALAILSGTATARQMLQSGSSGAPSWSTATWPATTTINRLLYSSATNTVADLATANGAILNTSSAGVPALTPNPVIGVNGSVSGTVRFNGSTSGTVTLTPQAAAGSPTVTLPNASGTVAVSADMPLVLNTTTGALTCPTCLGSDVTVYATSIINALSTDSTVAINRTSPTTTTINLPTVASRNQAPLRIVDWSNPLTENVITITPNGSETILRLSSWTAYSTSSGRTVLTLYPSVALNGWFLQ